MVNCMLGYEGEEEGEEEEQLSASFLFGTTPPCQLLQMLRTRGDLYE